MANLYREHESLWVQTSPATAYPSLLSYIKVDVAVIGAGIAGLTTAFLLKQAGAMVAVIEADRVCSGVTAYTTAKLTALHGLIYHKLLQRYGEERTRIYGTANLAAIDLVHTLTRQLRIDCALEETEAYTYTMDPDRVAAIEAEAQAALRVGMPVAFTEQTDLPFPVMAAVRMDKQAMFHPRRYCLALAEAIPGDASHVFEMTRALDVEQGEPCTIQTNRGTLRAEHVVLTTHLPFLDRGGFFAKTYPERSYAIAAELNGKAPRGMYLSIDEPKRSIRSAEGGDFLIVGGENHKVGYDPDTRNRYAALHQWAREHFPVQSIECQWSAQDYIPVDDLPYIGRMPRATDRLLLATGFNKWGMSTGTLAGMILTDMILGRDNPWQELFNSTRMDPRHGARKFIRANLDVAKRFVRDRAGRAQPLAILKPGEGGIVELNSRKVAAYRQPDGMLHVLSPTCPHMGCLLAWNAAEKTWDCPCHGSRFDYDGALMHGPALRELPTYTSPD